MIFHPIWPLAGGRLYDHPLTFPLIRLMLIRTVWNSVFVQWFPPSLHVGVVGLFVLAFSPGGERPCGGCVKCSRMRWIQRMNGIKQKVRGKVFTYMHMHFHNRGHVCITQSRLKDQTRDDASQFIIIHLLINSA